jgi:hypothetical protein
MNNYTSKKTNENGDTFYYNDEGKLHRTDGPAIEYVNGEKYWYVNGVHQPVESAIVQKQALEDALSMISSPQTDQNTL